MTLRGIISRFVLLTLVASSLPAAALPSGKPLMLVRFNQPRVAFERQLYTVVEKAAAIKPSVMFDVVSYVPVGGEDTRNGGARVVSALKQMGVPEGRIAFQEVPSRGIQDTEVRIYVR